jgi:hypothetical protein
VADEVEQASAAGLSGEPREFVFHDISWTRDELAEFEIWQAFGGQDLEESVALAHRRARRRALVAFLAVFVFACAIVLGVQINSPLVVQVALLFLLPLLIVLLTNLRHVLRGRKGIKRWILGGVVTKPVRISSVTVTPEGVTSITENGTVVDPWSHYAKVEVTALLVTCRCYDGRFGGIPKRCIGQGKEFDRVNGLILRWFREGGGGRAEPTLERLRTLDAPCKRCGYNLRGVDKLICPECGRALDLVTL